MKIKVNEIFINEKLKFYIGNNYDFFRIEMVLNKPRNEIDKILSSNSIRKTFLPSNIEMEINNQKIKINFSTIFFSKEINLNYTKSVENEISVYNYYQDGFIFAKEVLSKFSEKECVYICDVHFKVNEFIFNKFLFPIFKIKIIELKERIESYDFILLKPLQYETNAFSRMQSKFRYSNYLQNSDIMIKNQLTHKINFENENKLVPNKEINIFGTFSLILFFYIFRKFLKSN